MTAFLVERYLSGTRADELAGLLARLRREARVGSAIYLGSIYVPADEACFCRFEAIDAESVAAVNDRARAQYARLVECQWLPADNAAREEESKT
jgi:hypothetical protein